MMMIVGVSGLVLVFILSPFFIGRGGELASASALSSAEHLTKVKKAIVERYVKDLRAFESKEIGKKSWSGRQEFLLRRYIDATRRLDYLLASSEPSETRK